MAAPERCDCDRFPAMHDSRGVCVNWLRHASTTPNIHGTPIYIAEACEHEEATRA